MKQGWETVRSRVRIPPPAPFNTLYNYLYWLYPSDLLKLEHAPVSIRFNFMFFLTYCRKFSHHEQRYLSETMQIEYNLLSIFLSDISAPCL